MQRGSLTLAKPCSSATGEQWVTKDATPAPTEMIAECKSRAPAVTPQKAGTVSKLCIGKFFSKLVAWIQTAFVNINDTFKAEQACGLAIVSQSLIKRHGF